MAWNRWDLKVGHQTQTKEKVILTCEILHNGKLAQVREVEVDKKDLQGKSKDEKQAHIKTKLDEAVQDISNGVDDDMEDLVGMGFKIKGEDQPPDEGMDGPIRKVK